MQDLSGKVALITGASRRLGRAISLRLAASGCSIVVHYRTSSADAVSLCEQIRSAGGKAEMVQGSLENYEDCRTLLEKSGSLFGSLHFLVNNASIYRQGGVDASMTEFMDMARVNALIPLRLSREFAERADEGCIVNMLDARISGHDSTHLPYYLSKKLLSSITENLALIYAPRIRINAVAPGLILPPEGKGEDFLKRLSLSVPLQRHGYAEDVAEAVHFLISSDFVTGQTVYVDGGQHLLMHQFRGKE